jgi:hypothetical protein
LICTPLNANFEQFLVPALYRTGSFVALTFSGLTDGLIYVLRRLAFKRRNEPYVDGPGPRLSSAARLALDTPADAFHRARQSLWPRLLAWRYLLVAGLSALKEFFLRHITALVFILAGLAALAVGLAAWLLG